MYLPVIKAPESLQNLLIGVLIFKYEITLSQYSKLQYYHIQK